MAAALRRDPSPLAARCAAIAVATATLAGCSGTITATRSPLRQRQVVASASRDRQVHLIAAAAAPGGLSLHLGQRWSCSRRVGLATTYRWVLVEEPNDCGLVALSALLVAAPIAVASGLEAGSGEDPLPLFGAAAAGLLLIPTALVAAGSRWTADRYERLEEAPPGAWRDEPMACEVTATLAGAGVQLRAADGQVRAGMLGADGTAFVPIDAAAWAAGPVEVWVDGAVAGVLEQFPRSLPAPAP